MLAGLRSKSERKKSYEKRSRMQANYCARSQRKKLLEQSENRETKDDFSAKRKLSPCPLEIVARRNEIQSDSRCEDTRFNLLRSWKCHMEGARAHRIAVGGGFT